MGAVAKLSFSPYSESTEVCKINSGASHLIIKCENSKVKGVRSKVM